MIEMTDKENFSGCTLLESLMPKLLRTIIFVILRFFFFKTLLFMHTLILISDDS